MDPPANKPNRVTQPGPFSVGLATAASQGFGPQGPSDRTGFTVGSSAPAINTPPVFSAEAEDQTARLYEAFSYTVPQATVADGGAVSYSAWRSDLSSLPDWLSFNAATLTFSGTPEIDDFPATLEIVVIATDEDASPQTATTEFTLTVARPTWNMPPRFHEGHERTTRTLAENSPAGTKVGKPVTAFDPNGDALSYLYLDGGDAAYFSLDPDTGQLTTIEGVTYDYETKSTYDDLLVIVEETDTEEAQHTGINVTVNLTDVQEEESTSDDADSDTDESTDESETEPETPANTAPSFDANLETTLSVDENSAARTNVGSAITASDPDEGDTLTYSLTGTDAASFTIGSSSGQIATKTGVTYNFEAKSSYSLTVNVSDGNGGAATVDVTVSLNDVNEAPAFAAATAARSLPENSAAGTNVGSAVTATDPDTGDTLTYSLSGTDAASFTIDSATGQISTATGASFDFETKTSYALIVSAADPDGLSDSVSVTVSVTDVAEPSPPTASAGDDFYAKRGEVMTLNGTGTAHASGSQTLTYLWAISDASDDELVTVGNKGFLTNATQATATFTVMKKRNMTNKSVLNNGNWIEFTLTVKDGDGESHSDKVKLTIQGTTWKATVQ